MQILRTSIQNIDEIYQKNFPRTCYRLLHPNNVMEICEYFQKLEGVSNHGGYSMFQLSSTIITFHQFISVLVSVVFAF